MELQLLAGDRFHRRNLGVVEVGEARTGPYAGKRVGGCDEVGLAKLGVQVHLPDTGGDRPAHVVEGEPGGAVQRHRHVDLPENRVEDVPAQSGRLAVVPVDVPDRDGEATGAGLPDELLRFVRVGQSAPGDGPGDVLVALDAAELRFDAAAVLHGDIGGGRDEGDVLAERQVRSVCHHRADSEAERCLDHVEVAHVIELHARKRRMVLCVRRKSGDEPLSVHSGELRRADEQDDRELPPRCGLENALRLLEVVAREGHDRTARERFVERDQHVATLRARPTRSVSAWSPPTLPGVTTVASSPPRTGTDHSDAPWPTGPTTSTTSAARPVATTDADVAPPLRTRRSISGASSAATTARAFVSCSAAASPAWPCTCTRGVATTAIEPSSRSVRACSARRRPSADGSVLAAARSTSINAVGCSAISRASWRVVRSTNEPQSTSS